MAGPKDAEGDGPYMYLAVPSALAERLPVNATRLLREWEASLDPVRAVAEAAFLLSAKTPIRWVLTDRFVEPGVTTLDLIRHVGGDDEVIERFEHSQAMFVASAEPEGNRLALRRMVTRKEARYALAEPALPVLLGLAVLAPMMHSLGYYGRRYGDTMRHAWETAVAAPTLEKT
jgi:hypothetical protein